MIFILRTLHAIFTKLFEPWIRLMPFQQTKHKSTSSNLTIQGCSRYWEQITRICGRPHAGRHESGRITGRHRQRSLAAVRLALEEIGNEKGQSLQHSDREGQRWRRSLRRE